MCPSALADLVQGATNQPMSIYEMGPAAHAMERVVVEWMTEQVGWPEAGPAGCSPTAARSPTSPRCSPRARPRPPGRVDRGRGRHARGARAALGALLGHAQRGHARARRAGGGRPRGGRARADRARARSRMRSSAPGCGRRPMALVAAACATSTGLHDDLEAVGGVLPRARHLVPRGRRARRVRAALAARTGTAPRHRARGLGHLGRAQDAAHLGLCAAVLVREAWRARRRLPAEGLLPDLRGRRRGAARACSAARSSARRRRSA